VTRLPGTVLPVVWLVVPVLVEQTLALGVGFTDKWLSGNLLTGAEYLAAVGMVAYCVGFLPGLFAVPSVAATALVARAVGAGDLATARRAAAVSLLVGAAIALGLLVPAVCLGRTVVGLFGLAPESRMLAERYLAIVVPAIPAIMLLNVGVAILRGAGDMLAGLTAMGVVNVVNVLASWGLAAGLAGLPPLGWEGIAWGTAIGYVAGAVVVIVALARRAATIGRDGSPGVDSTVGRILAIGVPAGIDTLANAILQLSFLSIVNRLGDVDAAAHAIAITIESIAYLPGSAFQVAAATLAGQFLGAGDPGRARRTVWLATASCAAFMTVVAVCFYLEADRLAGLFVGAGTASEGVSPIAARLVRIVAFAQPFLAMLMVFAGGLRGAGKTRLPLAVNAFGLLAVRLPLAVFLARPSVPLPGTAVELPGLGLGVEGAWYAMAVDLAVRGVGMALLFAVAIRERPLAPADSSGPWPWSRYTCQKSS
jgi:putative MATE family efflux protein